ncbi:hypothetical protein ACHQM5_023373 [Ranunculus cassubicifolius]
MGQTLGHFSIIYHPCWNAKLKKVGPNVLLLGEGWKRFVEDHSIEFGDILHFRFSGKSKFYVTIYDHSCCEKEKISENVSSFKYRQNSKLEKAKEDLSKTPEDNLVSGDSASPNNQNERSLGSGVPAKTRKEQERRAIEASCQFKSDYPYFLYTLSATSIKKGNMNVPGHFVKAYLPEMIHTVKIVDLLMQDIEAQVLSEDLVSYETSSQTSSRFYSKRVRLRLKLFILGSRLF